MSGNSKFLIKGPQTLKGEVVISGSKNAALPIIAATILSNEIITLDNVPKLTDVENLLKIIKNLGSFVSRNGSKVDFCNEGSASETDRVLSGKLRASIFLLGPMLAKNGEAKVYLPGGCNIGERPIDLHLKGLEKLGASIVLENDYVYAKAKKLVGTEIYLDFPSVGATENIMMAATLAKGTTILVNAAQEPEIEDLANFLNEMGADVQGAGTNKITINGVSELSNKATYSIMPDRIEAGTFLVAGALNHKNRVKVKNVCVKDLDHLIDKMKDMGVKFEIDGRDISVLGPMKLKPVDITTRPYPGFSTDLQPQMMTLLSYADGVSVIKETIFENRLNHAYELKKIGVDIQVNKDMAIVNGSKGLLGSTQYVGTTLESFDLRGGVSMILAALNSKGDSQVLNTYHIKRGYADILEKFKALGATIVEE